MEAIIQVTDLNANDGQTFQFRFHGDEGCGPNIAVSFCPNYAMAEEDDRRRAAFAEFGVTFARLRGGVIMLFSAERDLILKEPGVTLVGKKFKIEQRGGNNGREFIVEMS